MRFRPAEWAPTRERLLANRWLRPLAGRMADPALWRATRRSVRLGVAIGLFSGFILPLGQIPLAILIALPLRANLLVAASATLVTNPLTFPLIYWAAYGLGDAVIGWRAAAVTSGGVLAPLVTGLAILAGFGTIVGYAAAELAWRCRVRRRRATRRR